MKYLILGAGPAGLTFANCLLQHGETSFLILEKEEIAGGLCRSIEMDGAPLDLAGGHFLDVRRPQVVQFLFQFMPEKEWNQFSRDSRISLNGTLVSHPLEANLWQLSIEDQIEYLLSIAHAGCIQGLPMPEKFTDWIVWKLGDKIAENYMIPYNKKIFSKELNKLGTYWLDKLPSVSFEDTLKSCLEKKAYATQPGHAKYYYPKEYGYGEVWLRMAEAVKEHIIYKVDINQIDMEQRKVNDSFQAEKIINTIPWPEFKFINGLPDELYQGLSQLKYSSIEIAYHPEEKDTKAQWIYYPEEELSYHRILIRKNFYPGAKGYWTETNYLRKEKTDSLYSYHNQYAYPLNTIEKPEFMKKFLLYCKSKNIYGLGRWGEWMHHNSDTTVELAIKLEEELR